MKKLLKNKRGQGLTEYTLIVLLVALVFWVAVKDTKIGEQLSTSWLGIKSCLADPTGADCKSPGSGS